MTVEEKSQVLTQLVKELLELVSDPNILRYEHFRRVEEARATFLRVAQS